MTVQSSLGAISAAAALAIEHMLQGLTHAWFSLRDILRDAKWKEK